MKVAKNPFAQAVIVARAISLELGKRVIVTRRRDLMDLHILSDGAERWRNRVSVRKRKRLFCSDMGRRFTHRRLGGK